MALAFLCDVHITPKLVEDLRSKGYEADHAVTIGLGSADDGEIWSHAERRGAIIVTKDSDFVRLNVAQPGPRVILVRLGNCSNGKFLKQFEDALPRILDLFETGNSLVELA